MSVGIAQAQVHSDREGGAGGGGDAVSINGIAVTDANLNDTTPAAAAGRKLMEWQKSGTAPDSVSAQTPADVPVVLNRAVTDLDVVNTTVETAIFSFSVPANALGTNRLLRLRLIGDVLNNPGTTGILTLRVKFGGTTIYQDQFRTLNDNVDRMALFIDFWIVNQGATNDQVGGGLIWLGSTGGATAGIGHLGVAVGDWAGSPVRGIDTAIDTTAAQTFEVTVQWTTAHGSSSCRRRFAVLELV